MDLQTHRRLKLLIDLVHFRNPGCTAEIAMLSPESAGQFHMMIRSTEDDSEVLDFIGRAPDSNEDMSDLLAILCHQIDFKKSMDDLATARH